MNDRERGTVPQPLPSSRLSQDAIGRRIDRVFETVTERLCDTPDEPDRPRWVPPSEFVRILSPYIGWN